MELSEAGCNAIFFAEKQAKIRLVNDNTIKCARCDSYSVEPIEESFTKKLIEKQFETALNFLKEAVKEDSMGHSNWPMHKHRAEQFLVSIGALERKENE